MTITAREIWALAAKTNKTIVLTQIRYKFCSSYSCPSSLHLNQFECKTSNDFVFHRHRTKHHGSIDTSQISRKQKLHVAQRHVYKLFYSVLSTSPSHQTNSLTNDHASLSRVSFCEEASSSVQPLSLM